MKTKKFLPIIFLLIIFFLSITLLSRRIQYYSIEGTGLYLARSKERLFITTYPHRFCEKHMLRAWNTWITCRGGELVSLYIPKTQPMVVAVHSKKPEGESHGQWILWVPYDIKDIGNMARVDIRGRSIQSTGASLRKMTRKEINDAPNRWPNFTSDMAVEESKRLLEHINPIDSPVHYTIIDNSEETKTIALSTKDYIKCFGGVGGIGFYYYYPYFYIHEDFPNSVILQNWTRGLEIHCTETFVLQVPYSVSYNDYFSNSAIIDFNKNIKSAANK